jgi:Cu(I)/Ag(I) efflux system membrane fusion protein
MMNMLFKTEKETVRMAVLACIGLLVFGCSQQEETARAPDNPSTPAQTMAAAPQDPSNMIRLAARETEVFACPMNCVKPMEKPGQCPVCGMDLVPISAQDHAHDAGPVRIGFSEEKVRIAGIQVAPVERKYVTRAVRLFGKIEYDPVEQYKVTAFAPGIIDRIYVKRAGQTVRAGDPLFDMHSSELFVLEQDLFKELRNFPDPVDSRPAKGQIYKRQMRPPRRQFHVPRTGEAPPEEIQAKKASLERIEQFKRKMMLLGLTREDIERVMARGLPTGISTVTTPTTGIVQEQYAFKGSYVNTGETIFTIANPRYIWARLDGYAADYPWIRLGQQAEFQVDTYPGETFSGKVIYLDPEFNPQTRTFSVGVLHTDPSRRLKPNMLVRCVIHAQMTAKGVAMQGRSAEQMPPPLVMPDTAPLITGNRAVVYVRVPGPSPVFEAREVILGPKAHGYYVVKTGLHEGEEVVVNGNFKIDSAIQILARPSMMSPRHSMAMTDAGDHAPHKTVMPMKMESSPDKPAAAGQKTSVTEKRRKRFSELLQNRSMKSSGRMRTDPSRTMSPEQHQETGSLRQTGQQGMQHMEESGAHGDTHQVTVPQPQMQMGGEHDHAD